MLFDSRAASACYAPVTAVWKNSSRSGRERGGLKHAQHMKVTSLQAGEIMGPDGKVTAGWRHWQVARRRESTVRSTG